MNKLARIATLAGLLLFGACSSAPTETMGTDMMQTKCVISGEGVDASSPSVDFHGTKVMFCCKDCQMEFEKLDDAGKQAKIAAMK